MKIDRKYLSEMIMLFLILILVFLISAKVVLGSLTGLSDIFEFPTIYSGDGLLTLDFIQRFIEENSFFTTSRLSYPFGANYYDFPNSEFLSTLILKIIGSLSNSSVAALNLYYFLGFQVIFLASYFTLKKLEVDKYTAIAISLIYTFSPFHFSRIPHLYYTWYFVVPLFYWYGYKIFSLNNEKINYKTAIRKIPGHVFVLLCMASFGVYYAFFGVIVLLTSTLLSFLKNLRLKQLVIGLAASATICLGVISNVSPSIYYTITHGKNPEVAQRLPMESDIYGMKLTPLLLPVIDHRVEVFAKTTQSYLKNFPGAQGNSINSFGIIGAIGFVLSLFAIFLSMVNRENDQRLKYFSVVSLVLFMFATIGGFSSLFAMFVSPSIRAWDRASIFILFASISSFFLYFSKIFQSQLGSRIYKYYSSILLVVVVIGIFDQTKPACIECIKTSRAKFLADRDFVKTIEALLPLNSAIYQMPYIQTLEVASLNSLPTYDSFEGHFHSSNLKWSYGGMNGREGDLFYRALSEETVEKQVEVIKRMGFSGIYIDRRGYKDHGNSVIARLGAVLNKSPTLVRADGERVFFQINSDPLAKLDGLSFFDIAKHAEYFVDRNGPRYTATLAEGIDFRRKGLPMFIKDLKGLSAVEANGRWSDANISSTVKIDFFDPLPNQFTLVITGAPFGPNAEKFLTIRIGTKTHRMLIPTSNFELSLPVNLPGELITSIEFIPPQPTSPEEIGLSSDNRKLGIGFRSIQFEH